MLNLNKAKAGFTSRYQREIITIDSHTQGEPTRLLISGAEDLKGSTIAAKREDFQRHYDHVRCLLTHEPRGHRDMFVAAVTEPVSSGAHFGLIYMDAKRYPYLCGHATIGAVTTLIETGAIQVEEEEGEPVIVVDTPSGQLLTYPQIKDGRVLSVGIDMVPSFVSRSDIRLEVPGFGNLNIDLVCVGGFFAMVSASSVGLKLIPENSSKLISLGMSIIEAANNALPVSHPERPEVSTVDVTEFYDDDAEKKKGTSVVVYGEAHMDRSPCGTGTAAKMTLMHHRKKLSTGELYRNGSPLGTEFEGRIIREVMIGGQKGIIARITGSASLTGYHQFVVDSKDPFQKGFLL